MPPNDGKRILVTADLIIDIYISSKKMKAKQRKEALEKCKLLSKCLNEYITL